VYVHKNFDGGAARPVARSTVRLLGGLIFAGFLGSPGCGTDITASDNGGPLPTLSLSNSSAEIPTHVESGNNHILELAQLVDVTESAQAIQGQINGANDVDVYDLGPVVTGDRILVDVAVASTLQGAVALFDATGSTLLVNDHRNVYLGRQGPFVDVVIRRESQSCLVAFAATPGFDSPGDYELTASMEPSTPLPPIRPDVFILDFEGGRNVRIGNRPAISVPAFDAANISPDFSELTDALIAHVVARVRRDFDGYNVTILSTSEGATDDETVSRVHFGTYDPALLGVADGVDEYNAVQAQHAIVFSDTFDAFNTLHPTVAQMGQALANVASHEIGHLLGLVHTKDTTDIMDVTASLRQLMDEQFFGRAPIYSQVFPLGHQDSAQLLLDGVGGDPKVLSRASNAKEWRSVRKRESDFGPPARERMTLSGCDLECR
jgi:hypothetical protein